MSILKRTVFYDKTGGFVRFWDWGLTTTTIGTMAEPFNANARRAAGDNTNIGAFNPTDEMTRIDDMVEADIGRSLIMLSGGDNQIHGGCMIPRTGR